MLRPGIATLQSPPMGGLRYSNTESHHCKHNKGCPQAVSLLAPGEMHDGDSATQKSEQPKNNSFPSAYST